MDKIAEVIVASTAEFTAECYELYNVPALGSLVKTSVAPMEIFGIVCEAGTSSIEPGRRPIARGKDEPSEEAIYQSSPQLLKLLRSEFRVLVVGHQQNKLTHQYLPPKPARIHSFVHQCSPEEIKSFSRSFDFLSLLINCEVKIPPEELISAALREMSREQEDPQAFLVSAGKQLAGLLGGDYPRLKTILGRLRP